MARKRKKGGVVYSTRDGWQPDQGGHDEQETLPPEEQELRVLRDRKQRKGKTATVVTGFVGTAADLKALAKALKSACGVGGAAKNGELVIQGDVRDKVVAWLTERGYNARPSGG